MIKKKKGLRRNPMAGLLAHGAARQKIVPTKKQKQAQKIRRQKPEVSDENS